MANKKLTQEELIKRLADWRARFLKRDRWLGIDEEAINQLVRIVKKQDYMSCRVKNLAETIEQMLAEAQPLRRRIARELMEER